MCVIWNTDIGITLKYSKHHGGHAIASVNYRNSSFQLFCHFLLYTLNVYKGFVGEGIIMFSAIVFVKTYQVVFLAGD